MSLTLVQRQALELVLHLANQVVIDDVVESLTITDERAKQLEAIAVVEEMLVEKPKRISRPIDETI